jgi:hypothetical protein
MWKIIEHDGVIKIITEYNFLVAELKCGDEYYSCFSKKENLNNAKKIIEAQKTNINIEIDWDGLLSNFKKITGKTQTRIISKKVRNKYISLLKEGYKKKDILIAMKNAIKDGYHIETNFKYLTLEYFSRSKTIDLFTDMIEVNKNNVQIKTKEYDR